MTSLSAPPTLGHGSIPVESAPPISESVTHPGETLSSLSIALEGDDFFSIENINREVELGRLRLELAEKTGCYAPKFVPEVSKSAIPFDEDEKAQKIRLGLTGITRREGLRLKEFHKAKDLQWPVPYRWQPYPEWEAELSSYLVGLALRYMKARGFSSRSRSDQALMQEISVEVYKTAEVTGSDYLTGEDVKPTRGSTRDRNGDKVACFTGVLSCKLLDRKTDEAAAYAFEVWRDEYYDQRSAAAAKGGRISKRPKEFTPDQLDGIEHMSKVEQAKVLGCSVPTIARLRKARKE